MLSRRKVNVNVVSVFVLYALIVPVIVVREHYVVIIGVRYHTVYVHAAVGKKASHGVLSRLKVKSVKTVVGNVEFPCNGLSGFIPCILTNGVVTLFCGMGGTYKTLGSVGCGIKGRRRFVKIVFRLYKYRVSAHKVFIGKSGGRFKLRL